MTDLANRGQVQPALELGFELSVQRKHFQYSDGGAFCEPQLTIPRSKQ